MKKLGTIAALWRYPVKSMAGELLLSCPVTTRGLLGDRAYALIDQETGMVASAKNPRLWPDLFLYKAAFAGEPTAHGVLPTPRITLPNGKHVERDTNESLSVSLGRRVTLASQPPPRPMLQQYWPDQDKVTNEAIPAGTFFDLALINVLLTSTLDRLSSAYPQGSFDVRRFRPNIVVTPAPGSDLEEVCVASTLRLGKDAGVHVDSRCGRCVMTTLAQPGLSKDAGILRAIAQTNGGFVGLNTTPVGSGIISVGDEVWVV